MMEYDVTKIATRIKEVAIRETNMDEKVARDVAFHMTDWLEELKIYTEFCGNPNDKSDEEIEKLLISFLTHVPNHVAAASKLYIETPVTDIFGVGATSEE